MVRQENLSNRPRRPRRNAVSSLQQRRLRLSQNELKAIRAHPLKKGLETFRTTFKSRYLKSEDVNLTEIVNQLTSEASEVANRRQERRISYLILSRHFKLSQLLGLLICDISSLIVQVTSNTLKIEYIAPLIKLVFTKAEDADIWTAVFDLIARTRPL